MLGSENQVNTKRKKGSRFQTIGSSENEEEIHSQPQTVSKIMGAEKQYQENMSSLNEEKDTF